MTIELCSCGSKSVWCYMPGVSSGDSPYFCDDCVPRGCDCNHVYCGSVESSIPNPKTENIEWKWIEKGKVWTHIDGKMREYPCAEFSWDSDGYERDINPHVL